MSVDPPQHSGRAQLSDKRPPFQVGFLGPRYWHIWLGLGALWCLAWCPAAWRGSLSRGLCRLVFPWLHKRREIIDTNLSWCFPELSADERVAIARRYFARLIQSVLDYGVMWWGSQRRVRQHVVVHGQEHLQGILDAGRSAIIVTGHSPGLERGGWALALDFPMMTFANESDNPMLEWLMHRWRTRLGGLLFPRSGGVRPLVKGLRQGHVLYLMADEDLGPESSRFIPFFGIPRATLSTPLRLARMARAEVLTSYTWYDDASHRYVISLEPPLEGSGELDEDEGLRQLNTRLEQAIRQHPEQYMWSMRLFKTMFDGSPTPYRMKSRPGSGPRPRPQVDGGGDDQGG